MKTTTTATATKTLTVRAAALFAVTVDRVPAVMWALGLRETCSRCAGSGRHSYNQINGDTCFGCNGRGERAAKVSRVTLTLASEKVAAGELDAVRARARALRAAKAEIAPLVAQAHEIYSTIGQAYTAASLDRAVPAAEFVQSPLFRAQSLNNALYYDSISMIEFAVTSGSRRNYIAAKAEILELTACLAQLRAAWLAFA